MNKEQLYSKIVLHDDQMVLIGESNYKNAGEDVILGPAV